MSSEEEYLQTMTVSLLLECSARQLPERNGFYPGMLLTHVYIEN